MRSAILNSKRPNNLYKVSTAEEFSVGMLAWMEGDATWHPAQFVADGALTALLVVGSIPLGIGSCASDVDLVAIVRGTSDLPSSFPADDRIVFAARTGTQSANIVIVSHGLEIDIQFIAMSWLSTTYKAATGNGAMPSLADMNLLGQIKLGWVLAAERKIRSFLVMLQKDRSIEIRSSVRAYVSSLKTLEDAIAARTDNPVLALHLGRLAVERALGAYLAAQGSIGLGDKWLRLDRQATGQDKSAPLFHLFDEAEGLLFPTFDLSENAVRTYLQRVTSFNASVKTQVETSPAYRIAFRVCPQIINPDLLWSGGENVADA